jgi:ribonucleoside-diphosphate reductase alpha chain
VKREDFDYLFKRIQNGRSGEPSIFFTNDSEVLCNPCSEINLKSAQVCNLTEINGNEIDTQEEFDQFVKVAAFLGTLQASYTNFHFLKNNWKKNTDKDALLGISITGLANEKFMKLDMTQSAKRAIEENKRVAKLIGIKPAARLTTVKPSGTLSLVLGTSSGIHAWFAPYYIRRIRLNKNEPIYLYLKEKLGPLVEDDFEKPNTGGVVSFPIKSPDGAITSRDETAIEFLERIKYVFNNWIKAGHIKGNNTNNVSSTVYVKDNEWDEVKEWMWSNKDSFNSITLLPFDNTQYIQMPYEEITKEKYEELMKYVTQIDLSEVKEEEDIVDLKAELACGASGCDLLQI